eukprot:6042406-Alexandrium_andersonii.AAC.2
MPLGQAGVAALGAEGREVGARDAGHADPEGDGRVIDDLCLGVPGLCAADAVIEVDGVLGLVDVDAARGAEDPGPALVQEVLDVRVGLQSGVLLRLFRRGHEVDPSAGGGMDAVVQVLEHARGPAFSLGLLNEDAALGGPPVASPDVVDEEGRP